MRKNKRHMMEQGGSEFKLWISEMRKHEKFCEPNML